MNLFFIIQKVQAETRSLDTENIVFLSKRTMKMCTVCTVKLVNIHRKKVEKYIQNDINKNDYRCQLN